MNVTKNCYYNNYTQTHTFIQFLGGDHKRISCFLIWKPISKRTSLCPGFLVYLKQRGGAKPDTKEIALGLQCKRFKKMAKACSWQRDSYKLVPRQLFLNVKPKGEWKQLMFLAFSLHSKADKESMEFFIFSEVLYQWRKKIIHFSEYLCLFTYITVFINVAMIKMYELLCCCCKHSLYRLCLCALWDWAALLITSGLSFFLLNDRLDEYKMAEVFSSFNSIRLWCGSEGQGPSLVDGVLTFWFAGWEEWPCRPRLSIMGRIFGNVSTDTSAYL